MSQQLLVRGSDEDSGVAALARTMRRDQLDEIGLMTGRLSEWFGRDHGWMGRGMMW